MHFLKTGRAKCLLVAAIFVLSPALWAENLKDILEAAKQGDSLFLGAGYEQKASAESVKQARARLLPTLNFSMEDKDTDQTIVRTENIVYASGTATYPTETSSLTLSQSIFNYEHWMRYQKSKQTRHRAAATFTQAYQDMLLRVSERYFEQLKMKEQLLVSEAETKAMKRHLDYAEKSRQAGLGRVAEVRDAEARYLTSLAKKIEHKKQYDDSRYSMMEVIGRLPELEALAPLKAEIPLMLPEPANVEQWIDRGLANNPDVEVSEKAYQEARYEVRAQKSGHYPTLSLEVNKFEQETGGSLFGGGSEVETQDMILRLNVPIYQGGVVSSRHREAVQRMYKAKEDVVTVKRRIRNEAQSAYHGVVANIAQIKALRGTVVAQEAVLLSKQKGYQTGLYSVIAVLDSQQDLAIAQQNYIAARNDYVINVVRLKRAAGVLLDSDLLELTTWLREA